MASVTRLLAITFLAVTLIGCGGSDGPQDERFNQTVDPSISLANDVRAAITDLDPGTNLADVGAELAETLGEEMENPAIESNKETYEKIIAAANAMAAGDKSKLAEIKTLADSLPK